MNPLQKWARKEIEYKENCRLVAELFEIDLHLKRIEKIRQ